MHTKFQLPDADSRIVYVRAVDVADLPQDIRDEIPDVDQVYSVHKADGEQLALVNDRRTAFFLAREHDYTPMTVH
ncbi:MULTISPECIES: DUF1150 domain-containing protein [Halocynthiibacter]|uniref:DUF1150 domain-containing protein n=1 Tax=Halocynthiibacter halioticoli TaxID=2986804 RepID=A0AAE3LQN7_9RHOB|nr:MULTISPECIES: DUF1150 domain-containing protein [Halocynthiibacter]MCV6823709.1 DUF1150 domain-containing protein [Halocynthiibacter halioticoli]MCW4056710.1 DUF1150 domain-containing protein [Halocynthiibacter sp. SDUM655004]MDE0590273.1 DUF1150 domain-containing protein [Halocynthiibacter sp. C4]